MPATPNSTMFSAVDYADGALTVTFKNNKSYTHPGVPPETYTAFLGSASMGKFYNSNIKSQYPHSA